MIYVLVNISCNLIAFLQPTKHSLIHQICTDRTIQYYHSSYFGISRRSTNNSTITVLQLPQSGNRSCLVTQPLKVVTQLVFITSFPAINYAHSTSLNIEEPHSHLLDLSNRNKFILSYHIVIFRTQSSPALEWSFPFYIVT